MRNMHLTVCFSDDTANEKQAYHSQRAPERPQPSLKRANHRLSCIWDLANHDMCNMHLTVCFSDVSRARISQPATQACSIVSRLRGTATATRLRPHQCILTTSSWASRGQWTHQDRRHTCFCYIVLFYFNTSYTFSPNSEPQGGPLSF